MSPKQSWRAPHCGTEPSRFETEMVVNDYTCSVAFFYDSKLNLIKIAVDKSSFSTNVVKEAIHASKQPGYRDDA